ncbi:hypothetical protein [Streptomyces melanogenes]|uniref:Uncharacterized protein n=1 Tax=Streptomyces melanogenes TaxID=67326 RepID=A0ABZ1XXA2_9ACTN|nr:hypothetical protein [Streptomyces melanogenes]
MDVAVLLVLVVGVRHLGDVPVAVETYRATAAGLADARMTSLTARHGRVPSGTISAGPVAADDAAGHAAGGRRRAEGP